MCLRIKILALFVQLFLISDASLDDTVDYTIISTTNHPPQTDNLTNYEQRLLKIELKLEQLQKSLDETVSNRSTVEDYPEDCLEVKKRGATNFDIYVIKPKLAPKPFLVVCDMTTRGGGWAYILNRHSAATDFRLSWADYKAGFGNLVDNFWLGLEHIYELTNSKVNELLVEMVDWDMKRVYAHYKDFGIGNEKQGYNLKIIGRYSGTAGNSLHHHTGHKFKTADRPGKSSCASTFRGGWWYLWDGNCFSSHLTGEYRNSGLRPENDGIQWKPYRGSRYSLKRATMMVRPRRSSQIELVH